MASGAEGGTPVPPARRWEDPEGLLGVDEAGRRILAAFRPLEPVLTPILDALGMVLAEDIVATVDVPAFRNSAMDGFAARAADTASASRSHPVALLVVGDHPAGSSIDRWVGSGQAVRIMTGAPVPNGCDAVVRFEEVREYRQGGPAAVLIERPVCAGENVREPGEDIRRGETVLPAGTPVRSAEVGVLASLNRDTVLVHRRPRIGVLSTGDEVVEVGPELRPGQVRNSNGYTLAAMISECGGVPVLLGVARDRADDLRERLRRATDVDLLITSGGVSVGDYDVVKDVLRAEGQIALWQVRIKPGKPMAFGRIGSTPLLGLPGNPVAAAVAFLQFARPAIARMLGHRSWSAPTLRARLLAAQENRGGRRHFVRGVVEQRAGEFVVQPVGRQGSAVLTSMARANCLIVLPESCERAEAGAQVEVQLLSPDSALA